MKSKLKKAGMTIVVILIPVIFLFTCQLQLNKLKDKGSDSLIKGIAKDLKEAKEEFDSGFND